jgi:DNA-binding transcriptional LysR family regulator
VRPLNVVHEADTIHTTRILVAADLGVSVLPSFSQTKDLGSLLEKYRGRRHIERFKLRTAAIRDPNSFMPSFKLCRS